MFTLFRVGQYKVNHRLSSVPFNKQVFVIYNVIENICNIINTVQSRNKKHHVSYILCVAVHVRR